VIKSLSSSAGVSALQGFSVCCRRCGSREGSLEKGSEIAVGGTRPSTRSVLVETWSVRRWTEPYLAGRWSLYGTRREYRRPLASLRTLVSTAQGTLSKGRGRCILKMDQNESMSPPAALRMTPPPGCMAIQSVMSSTRRGQSRPHNSRAAERTHAIASPDPDPCGIGAVSTYLVDAYQPVLALAFGSRWCLLGEQRRSQQCRHGTKGQEGGKRP
jgi:hypothetical protein